MHRLPDGGQPAEPVLCELPVAGRNIPPAFGETHPRKLHHVDTAKDTTRLAPTPPFLFPIETQWSQLSYWDGNGANLRIPVLSCRLSRQEYQLVLPQASTHWVFAHCGSWQAPLPALAEQPKHSLTLT